MDSLKQVGDGRRETNTCGIVSCFLVTAWFEASPILSAFSLITASAVESVRKGSYAVAVIGLVAQEAVQLRNGREKSASTIGKRSLGAHQERSIEAPLSAAQGVDFGRAATT